jgi:hypothetical protein
MFVANMARLVDRLNSDPELQVRMVRGADDFCAACPHMDRGYCKRFGESVEDFDQKVMKRLGYGPGEIATWSSVLDNLSGAIRADQLDRYCGDCRWLKLNYCSDGLTALAASRNIGNQDG